MRSQAPVRGPWRGEGPGVKVSGGLRGSPARRAPGPVQLLPGRRRGPRGRRPSRGVRVAPTGRAHADTLGAPEAAALLHKGKDSRRLPARPADPPCDPALGSCPGSPPGTDQAARLSRGD